MLDGATPTSEVAGDGRNSRAMAAACGRNGPVRRTQTTASEAHRPKGRARDMFNEEARLAERVSVSLPSRSGWNGSAMAVLRPRRTHPVHVRDRGIPERVGLGKASLGLCPCVRACVGRGGTEGLASHLSYYGLGRRPRKLTRGAGEVRLVVRW